MPNEKYLTENSCERVFICQTVEIHDSRGRLLVRIGKVTVVRRPLQSMVCSGRLTICDQKCMAGPEIVYVAMNRDHVLSREPLQALRDQLRLAGAIYQQFSRSSAVECLPLCDRPFY